MRNHIEPGCLALLVRPADPSNAHKLVHVIARQPDPNRPTPPQVEVGTGSGAVWLIESLGSPFWLSMCGVECTHALARTSALRRIGYPPGDDETLEWAGWPPAEAEMFRSAMREAFVEIRQRRAAGRNPLT